MTVSRLDGPLPAAAPVAPPAAARVRARAALRDAALEGHLAAPPEQSATLFAAATGEIGPGVLAGRRVGPETHLHLGAEIARDPIQARYVRAGAPGAGETMTETSRP